MLQLLPLLGLAHGVLLPVPRSVHSADGVLDVVLTLERATITTSSGVTMRTRAFNGMVPGPTLRLKPGDRLRVRFQNLLLDQGSAYVHNQYSAADESNVHFHGLHVSGELPSDDSTVPVLPGKEHVYDTVLPAEHMPGTHWLHPHRHGSTALQVAGGAALALIVDDPPGTLPAQVEGAPEVLLVVMQIDQAMTNRMASQAGDSWFQISGGTLTTLVNGEVTPLISVTAGEWTRFRIIYAGWLDELLDLNIAGCEVNLLAKDGIYIRDFPRPLSGSAAIPTGGRADLMVRCVASSSEYAVTWGGNTIATIVTGSTVKSSENLPSWSPSYPGYLEDLRNSAASPNCSCEIRLDRDQVNGQLFEYGHILHQSYLGAVVERSIRARSHPYHQHVFPFQLISGFAGDRNREGPDNDRNDNDRRLVATNYDLPGDWHDTIEGAGVVRYKPSTFAGKVMLHCHRLDHEDKGMMAMEVVRESGPCTCAANGLVLPVIFLIMMGLASW